MAKTIQVRNVPDEVHHELKVRALEERKSLSDYVLSELERSTAKPTMKQVLARIASRESVELDLSPAELIREGREARGDHLAEVVKAGRRDGGD